MQKGPISKYPKAKKIPLTNRKWPDNEHTSAPIWASVDLRDGNQALAIPMNIEEKLKFFDCLVATGFKEIEVGFHSASDTEYNFIRKLIEENRIPEDVTIQVLVQAREHLIKKTFESLEGAHSAIIHLYNSTSPLQRKVTFNKSTEEYKGIKVYRSPIIPRGNGNGFNLFLNYISFVFFGFFKLLLIKDKFDKIFVYAPSPITVGYLGIVASFIFRAKPYLWVHDLWPESVKDAGGINNKFLLYLVDLMTKSIYYF